MESIIIEEGLVHKIREIAMKIHNDLENEFFEKVYEKCNDSSIEKRMYHG